MSSLLNEFFKGLLPISLHSFNICFADGSIPSAKDYFYSLFQSKKQQINYEDFRANMAIFSKHATNSQVVTTLLSTIGGNTRCMHVIRNNNVLLFLIAYKSNNRVLQIHIYNIIRRRVDGHDQRFLRCYPYAKSKDQRLTTYFRTFTNASKNDPEMLSLTGVLFSKLGYDYSILKRIVENHVVANNMANHSYISHTKGKHYLKELLIKESTEGIEHLAQKSIKKGKIFSNEIQILDKYLSALLKNSTDKNVCRMVRNIINEVTLSDNYWHYRKLFVLAQSSGNKKLQRYVQDILQKRIEGKDDKFNKLIGNKLKTTSNRLIFYFNEIVYPVSSNIGKSARSFAKTAGDLVSSIDLKYSLLKDYIENYEKWDNVYYKIAAQEFIAKKKGIKYLKRFSKVPRKP